MANLEEMSLEIGRLCDAYCDGSFVPCRAPAAFRDLEADEDEPAFYCESHCPAEDIYTTFTYA